MERGAMKTEDAENQGMGLNMRPTEPIANASDPPANTP